MEGEKPAPEAVSQWQKTQFANLVRYVPSGIYFARFRVRGKLIRKTCRQEHGPFTSKRKLLICEAHKPAKSHLGIQLSKPGGAIWISS